MSCAKCTPSATGWPNLVPTVHPSVIFRSRMCEEDMLSAKTTIKIHLTDRELAAVKERAELRAERSRNVDTSHRRFSSRRPRQVDC